MINNLTSFKFDKSDIYFFIIMCFIIYILYKELTRKETFATNDITNAVSQVYTADIEALRNLSGIAKTLMEGNNLNFPGMLTVTNNIVGSKDLTISGNMTISGKINGDIKITSNIIEFGATDTTKEMNAGKIGYGLGWDVNALSIVGKGAPDSKRKVHLWDDLQVNNNITTNNIDPNSFPDGWSGIKANDLLANRASIGTIFCGNVIKVGKWSIYMDSSNDELVFKRDNDQETRFQNDNKIFMGTRGHYTRVI